MNLASNMLQEILRLEVHARLALPVTNGTCMLCIAIKMLSIK